MKTDFYQNRLQKISRNILTIHRKLNMLSVGRIGFFLLFLTGLLLGYYKHTAFYILGIISLFLFIALVYAYSSQKQKERYLLAQEQVLTRMLDRKTGSWKTFSENGEKFLNENSPPRGKDLDLLGKNSLYQYLCRCHTAYGRQMLAIRLLSDVPNRETINSNQQAIKELSQKEDFCLELEALGQLMEQSARKQDNEIIETFIKLAETQPPAQPIFWKVLMWILPFITLFFLISAIIGVNSTANLGIGFIGILLELLTAGICWNQNNRILAPLLDFAGSIGPYRAIFARIESESFHSQTLQKLQNKIAGAETALQTLSSVATAVEARKNPFGFLLLGGLCMWDFHCADRFTAWITRYGKEIRSWLAVVGEFETDMSLAVPANIRREFVFPVIEENGPQLCGNSIKHPLLPEETAVGNGTCLSAQTCIITGSNMSGKTTFLRSIGLNLILAYAGAPTAAASFSASPMWIFTSMRVEDNVSEGISTFYAELLRIKDMVEFSSKKIPMICLIDEIFKGTNSADRIVGATETIQRLSVPHSIVLVSTHDFELCNLENNSHVKALNFHFSEHYTDDGIQFDYKMSPGRCRTTNAQYLLKMAGIL
ncbi:MAG: mannonate oxidoreductase [Clostridiales bacterium]|nr:MAG: mannonate oxidoreductase [Clostridiales bacterium]